ncbi:hypothetical protein M8494_09085 [Serratia ureilytica]
MVTGQRGIEYRRAGAAQHLALRRRRCLCLSRKRSRRVAACGSAAHRPVRCFGFRDAAGHYVVDGSFHRVNLIVINSQRCVRQRGGWTKKQHARRREGEGDSAQLGLPAQRVAVNRETGGQRRNCESGDGEEAVSSVRYPVV